MDKNRTIIDHPSQLNTLSAIPFFRTRGLGKIHLSDSFQHNEREQLEKDINKYYYACGCSTSAKFLIAGLLLGLLLNGIDDTLLNLQWKLHPITIILFTAIGGGIIGKLIGLVKANSKLKRSIHTVQAFWRPKTESTMKEQPDCG